MPPVVEAITFTRAEGKWTTDQKVAGKEFDESKASDLIDDLIDIRWSEALSLESEDVKGATGHFRKLVLHTKSLGKFEIQVGRSPAPPKPPKSDEEKEEDSEDAEDEDDTEDEPEPGPVITLIESKSVSDPLFRLAEKTAFDAGESLYDAIPETVAGFFKDPPPPPPPPPAAVSQTGGTSPTGAVTPAPRKKITVATPPIPVPLFPRRMGKPTLPRRHLAHHRISLLPLLQLHLRHHCRNQNSSFELVSSLVGALDVYLPSAITWREIRVTSRSCLRALES